MGSKFLAKKKKKDSSTIQEPTIKAESRFPSKLVRAEDLIYTVFIIPLISLVTDSVSLRHSNGSEHAICIRCQELVPGFATRNMLSYPLQSPSRATMPWN